MNTSAGASSFLRPVFSTCRKRVRYSIVDLVGGTCRILRSTSVLVIGVSLSQTSIKSAWRARTGQCGGCLIITSKTACARLCGLVSSSANAQPLSIDAKVSESNISREYAAVTLLTPHSDLLGNVFRAFIRARTQVRRRLSFPLSCRLSSRIRRHALALNAACSVEPTRASAFARSSIPS